MYGTSLLRTFRVLFRNNWVYLCGQGVTPDFYINWWFGPWFLSTLPKSWEYFGWGSLLCTYITRSATMSCLLYSQTWPNKHNQKTTIVSIQPLSVGPNCFSQWHMNKEMCQIWPLYFCDCDHPHSVPKVTKMWPKTTGSFLRGLFCHFGKQFFVHVGKMWSLDQVWLYLGKPLVQYDHFI